MYRYSLCSITLSAGLIAACGGQYEDESAEAASGTLEGVGEAFGELTRAPDEPEGYEPDEESPNLEAEVGSAAIAMFNEHKSLRAAGIEPEMDEVGFEVAEGYGATVRGAVGRRTIYGYVRDRNGRGVGGVRVTAFDADPGADDLMGRVYTNSRGYYEIHYRGGHWDPCPHRWTCWRPDIYVTVSGRDWKVEGDRYEGKPLCHNVTYGWRRESKSRQRNNWRLRRALNMNLRSRPKAQMWEERSDKPDCLRGPFCYNFSYIETSCMGFVESLTGCSGGYEYSWRAACFGYFSAVLDSRRLCFNTPRTRGGVCQGAEAPGGSTGPREGIDAPCEQNPWGGGGD